MAQFSPWRLVATAAAGALLATTLAAAAPATALDETIGSSPLPKLVFGDDSTDWKEILVDGDDVERAPDGRAYNVFGGFGSVSCNNTSRLLLDYREENPEAYWRILNMLFNTETGAGLAHIKVELGSDTNTSSGAEPATKRSADEPANVLRGAGFRLIADAKTINPDLKVEALRWGEPSWTSNDTDARYQWYKETIDAAFDTYGVEFDYLSPSQNEVNSRYIASELEWTIELAKRLEADAGASDARYDYGDIDIVALDSYRNGEGVAAAILASPEALEYVDAIGIHYTIGGGANLTRLNKEFGKEVIYSEGVAPMIDPEYRINAQPAMGGIGGTVGAVDIADRFINAYKWSGSGANPAHMTSFLFQPAVSALYEGSSYSPKHLIRASDPWSGYYEGGVGIVLVRHFMQFIGQGWEYLEGASGGDGTFADGGTAVESSTRTVLTLREPFDPVKADAEGRGAHKADFTQVHANNTAKPRFFEIKVADLGVTKKSPLYLWETTGPEAGEAYDGDWFQNIGYIEPVRTELGENETDIAVYRVEVAPYSILTISSLAEGTDGTTTEYASGDYAATAENAPLALPYADDFEYAGYPAEDVGGVSMSYLERRGGTPRYTADQNGAFEVVDSTEAEHGNVLQQRITAGNRGYTWNVWGDGSQNQLSTAAPTTILGDHTWANYTAAVDVKLDTEVTDAALPNFAGLGVRQVVTQGSDLATYAVRVSAAGAWELRKRDAVVASGTIAGFDADAWHRIALTATETALTPSVDGATLTTWTDASVNPVMTGRISLISGYYETNWDNLEITPVDGFAWQSAKVDDTESSLAYSGPTTFRQVGFAHYNRTNHELAAGASFAMPFTGSGIDLFGATAQATIDVSVDGAPPTRVAVGKTDVRQTSYWLRGLASGDHAITVTVVSGTFTLDGVDVLE